MGTKLYIGNLSYSTTEDMLRGAFAADGREVKEVSIITDRETGRPRGFAFVVMMSPADAANAIAALDGQQLDGRMLRVSEAREKTSGGGGGARGGAGAGRGAGAGGGGYGDDGKGFGGGGYGDRGNDRGNDRGRGRGNRSRGGF